MNRTLLVAAFLAIAHSASAGLAPVQVPEGGATVGLLALGLFALAGLRHKPRK
jgi:hypothetical protein